jgi:hypothetical protein
MSVPGEHLRSGPIGQRSDLHVSDRYGESTTTVIGSTTAVTDESAVSWGAIFAGAAAAASLSLILLILGTGLGLSSVSPWSFEGVSAETFGWSTIGWISFTSIAASGLGGYLAGRLRTKWTTVDRDESFFRDTAHGFLSWAVATLLTAALLTSAIGAILGTGVKAGASLAGAAAGTATTAVAGGAAAAGGAMATDEGSGMVDYWIDSLFRRNPVALNEATPSDLMSANDGAPETDGVDGADANASASSSPADAPAAASDNTFDVQAARAETARIFLRSLGGDTLDEGDSRYVAQLVAERTGMSVEEAQARVTDVHARMRAALDEAETTARATADEVRKASAYAALWLFITLLAGAFFAALFATFGGRQRDA